jgi:lipopolysaccharide heptosyltransferase II
MQQKNTNRILVVNPYGIGDVLFTTALLASLKRDLPKSYIAVLLGSRTKEILEYNSDVDQIYVFDKGKFDSLSKYRSFRVLFSLIKQLRQEYFDLLIDLSNSSKYGFFEKFFLNIPQRLGFNFKGRGRFLTESIDIDGYSNKHVVEYYLDFARLLDVEPYYNKLRFLLNENDLRWAKDFFRKNNITDENLTIAIVPGGGSSWGKDAVYKQWNKDKFAALADKLIQQHKANIIIAGSKKEENICDGLLSKMKNKGILSCGKTTLRQVAGLFKFSDLVICNDGGLLHIAVSQETPTVSIFGPVDEKVYGPYPKTENNLVVTKDIECRPCYNRFQYPTCRHHRCLEEITVDEVFKKANILIEKNNLTP